jgi:hypothetical protein
MANLASGEEPTNYYLHRQTMEPILGITNHALTFTRLSLLRADEGAKRIGACALGK